MLFIIATSDIFILTIFGEKWKSVTPILIVLAPVGMMQSVYSPAGAIFQAKGRTDWWFKWGIITGIIFVTAFIVGIKWGIMGVALAYLIVNLITIYPGLVIPFRLIELKVKDFVLSFRKTFFISLSMSIMIFGLKLILINSLGFTITFIISLIIGCVLYIVISLKFNSLAIESLLGFIRSSR
jgi:PST family polysaccharide transporter